MPPEPAYTPPSPAVRLTAALIQASARIADRLLRPAYGDRTALPAIKPEELTLSGRGVKLHCLHWAGDGPPLVLLHGINADAWSWARVAGLMSPGRDVYALSQRGHGLSDAPPAGYTLDYTAGDLDAVLERIASGPVDLAGESWGGKVALHYAATRPDKVRSLILADPAAAMGFNPLLRACPFLIHAALLLERLRFDDVHGLEEKARQVVYLPLGDEIDRRSWRERFTPTTGGGFAPRLPDSGYAEILETALAADMTDQLRGLKPPVLLMIPNLSIIFWPGELRRLRGLFSDLTERRIIGDHTFVSCNPRAAAGVMGEFLAGRFGGAK